MTSELGVCGGDVRAGGVRAPSMAGLPPGCRVTLPDVVPVNHAEEGLHVVRAEVLVLQVVGMLPDV